MCQPMLWIRPWYEKDLMNYYQYLNLMICQAGRNLVSHYVRAILNKTIKSLANNCKSAIFLQNDVKIATYRVGRNHE